MLSGKKVGSIYIYLIYASKYKIKVPLEYTMHIMFNKHKCVLTIPINEETLELKPNITSCDESIRKQLKKELRKESVDDSIFDEVMKFMSLYIKELENANT